MLLRYKSLPCFAKLSAETTQLSGKPPFIASHINLSPKYIAASLSPLSEDVYSRIGYTHTKGAGSSLFNRSAFKICANGSFTQKSGISPNELSMDKMLSISALFVLPSPSMRDTAIGR